MAKKTETKPKKTESKSQPKKAKSKSIKATTKPTKRKPTPKTKYLNGTPISLADKLRYNPKSETLVNKVLKVALTIGTNDQHDDAMPCAKLIIERVVPALKVQEIQLPNDGNLGVLVLPAKKAVGAPVDVKAQEVAVIEKSTKTIKDVIPGVDGKKKPEPAMQQNSSKAKKKLPPKYKDPNR